MRIFSAFKTLDNVLFYVNFVIDNDTSSQIEFRLDGKSPVRIGVEGSDENIYKSVKYSTMEVDLILDEPLLSLFSIGRRDIKATLTDQRGTIFWQGFVVPMEYDQSYTAPYEKFTVNCCDGLYTTDSFTYSFSGGGNNYGPIDFLYSSPADNNNINSTRNAEKSSYQLLINENEEESISPFYILPSEGEGGNVRDDGETDTPATGGTGGSGNNGNINIDIDINVDVNIGGGGGMIDNSSSSGVITFLDGNYYPAAVSFMSIVGKILYRAGYKGVWVEDVWEVDGLYTNLSPSNFSYSILEHLFICESNFKDEDGEVWKEQQVLEEICQYLHMSCISHGDVVYFIQYDALRKSHSSYYYYSLAEGGYGTPTKQGRSRLTTLNSKSWGSDDTTISLLPVYNKVIIKDSLYTADTFIPQPFDEKYAKGYNEELTTTSPTTLSSTAKIKKVVQGAFVVEDTYKGDVVSLLKYYSNPHYQSYYYQKDTSYGKGASVQSSYVEPVNYIDTQRYVGAVLLKQQTESVDTGKLGTTVYDFGGLVYPSLFENLGWDQIIHKVSLSPQILFMCHESPKKMENSFAYKTPQKVMEIKKNFDYLQFVPSDSYLIINGNLLYMDRENTMHEIDGYSNKNDECKKEYSFFYMGIEYGGYCYAGNGNWMKKGANVEGNPYYFPVPLDVADIVGDNYINKPISIKNTVIWWMGLGDSEGFVIPLPQNNNVNKNVVIADCISITFYRPWALDEDGDYRCDAVFLSDFNVEIKTVNKRDLLGESNSGEDETDTTYENAVVDESIKEMDEIEYKICTWDNKKVNYSSVCYKSGDTLFFLDKMREKWTGNRESHRLEEWKIQSLTEQYSSPRLCMEMDWYTGSSTSSIPLPYTMFIVPPLGEDKIWMIDEMEVDFANLTTNLKLIEKR